MIEIKQTAEEIMISEMLKVKTKEQLAILFSYNCTVKDLYDYIFGIKNICECSYELQCALFDTSEFLYNNYVDAWFINKFKDKRVDKNLKFLFYTKDFDVKSFNESIGINNEQ